MKNTNPKIIGLSRNFVTFNLRGKIIHGVKAIRCLNEERVMSDNLMNGLISVLAKQTLDTERLKTLETDVWLAIQFRGHSNSLSLGETVVAIFNVPKFQISSLAIALCLGIGISPLFSNIYPEKYYGMKDGLSMKVFTVDTPYLTANLIDRIQ